MHDMTESAVSRASENSARTGINTYVTTFWRSDAKKKTLFKINFSPCAYESYCNKVCNPDGEQMEVKRNWVVFPPSKISLDTKSHHFIPSFVISEAFWSQEIWKAGWNPSLEVAPWRLRTLLRCPHMSAWKLSNCENRMSLLFTNVLVFPVKSCPPLCAVNKNTCIMYLCVKHVCMQEMDAGVGGVWGTSGTWHWPPLIHTFLPPRLFYRQLPRDSCSVDLCNPEETPSLHCCWNDTFARVVGIFPISGCACARADSRRSLAKQGWDNGSRQASISPLMVEGDVLSSVFAAKVIYPLLK